MDGWQMESRRFALESAKVPVVAGSGMGEMDF